MNLNFDLLPVPEGIANDLYLDWIGLCPRNGVFSFVPAKCGDTCALDLNLFFAIITSAHKLYECSSVPNVALHIVRTFSCSCNKKHLVTTCPKYQYIAVL